MIDEIRVTLPRERSFGAVAGLVVGGVAARHNLTIDVLDDLQLALETLLEREDGENDVTIALRVDADIVEVDVGPFRPETLAELKEEPGETLGLRRLLEAVVDNVSVEERADGCWVVLRRTTGVSEAAA